LAAAENDLAEVSEEDIERLASRLAMLVSEDGESEAAGRAVAHLARRLGMTGGELKEMFLAGAVGRPRARAPQPAPAAELERMEREIAALRRGAREAESELRHAERERDALASEAERLRGALFRLQTISHVRRNIGGIVLVAVLIAGAVGYMIPIFSRAPTAPVPAPQAMQAPATKLPGDERPDVRRIATVRGARTPVYSEPDQSSRVIASLTPGSSVVVHRLFWNMLLQWAEVEVGSGVGFVVTTDIDVSR
jgi:hypothetical protein